MQHERVHVAPCEDPHDLHVLVSLVTSERSEELFDRIVAGGSWRALRLRCFLFWARIRSAGGARSDAVSSGKQRSGEVDGRCCLLLLLIRLLLQIWVLLLMTLQGDLQPHDRVG